MPCHQCHPRFRVMVFPVDNHERQPQTATTSIPLAIIELLYIYGNWRMIYNNYFIWWFVIWSSTKRHHIIALHKYQHIVTSGGRRTLLVTRPTCWAWNMTALEIRRVGWGYRLVVRSQTKRLNIDPSNVINVYVSSY